MHIGVISIYPFPEGMAASKRILSYSKGLVANDVNVSIFVPIPYESFDSVHHLNDYGTFDNINYYLTNGRYKSKLMIFRAISVLSGYRYFSGIFKTIFCLKKINSREKFDSVLISTDQIFSLFFYSYFLRCLKIKPVFIFDEYPYPIRHKLKENISIFKKFFFRLTLPNMSGYISISHNLANFYNSICRRDSFVLPIIVDDSYFSHFTMNKNREKYVCYMGNLELSKDNVDLIIKAFKIFSNNFPDYKLFLFGTPTNLVYDYLFALISSLNLESKVFFKGKALFKDVPDILMNASILVNSQPSTKRASGGFPTKLGEYIVSGTPSIITNVGENSKYVVENEHAFFVEANDIQGFADKMIFIESNYDFALNVAFNGRSFVLKNYSSYVIGNKMKKFLSDLI